jgi:hypothetical protein
MSGRDGRVTASPGSREPDPSVPALTGFDPSRMAALQIRCDAFEDCLRTVCHHLELPQSASGPCDDQAAYDRALESLDLLLRATEGERTVAVSRMHRAEAALFPFAKAALGLGSMWDDKRRAETVKITGLLIKDFRRALQVMNIARDSDGSPQGGDACGSVEDDSAAIAQTPHPKGTPDVGK